VPPDLRLDRLIAFGGRLQIRGWIESPVPVVSVELVVPGARPTRRRLPLTPSPTRLQHPRVRFERAWQAGVTGSALDGATVRARLADGSDHVLHRPGTPRHDMAHALNGAFRELLAEQGPEGAFLEVGSRSRSGNTYRDLVPDGWTYEGMDILPGDNVDTVGDAHRIASLYPEQRFDAVFAVSVLEHLVMPWRFVIELNHVLRPGAVGLFLTHQTWPLHDEPFDFFRFSDRAWRGLLNPATGFEIIEARVGEPAFVVPATIHAATAFDEAEPAGALVSAVLFRKVGPTALTWPVEPEDVYGGTAYPV